MSQPASIACLLECCERLFSRDVSIGAEFIEYLRPEGLKNAYRARILDTHPDKACARGIPAEKLAEEFRRVTEAYETLLPFVGRPAGTRFVPRFEKSGKRATFYSGKIPAIKLRLGTFLYYKGLISWETYLESLKWQRKNRPLIGQIALEWKFMSHADIADVLRGLKQGETFGEAARRLGRLTAYQVLTLLGKQARYDARVGRYFIAQEILTPKALDGLLLELYAHNCRCLKK